LFSIVHQTVKTTTLNDAQGNELTLRCCGAQQRDIETHNANVANLP